MMNSFKLRTCQFAFILAVSVFIISTPSGALADMVVISSDSPDLAPGQIIKEGQKIDIPDGKKVALVSDTGTPVNLKGPYSGVPSGKSSAGGGKGLADALSKIVAAPESEASKVSAIRALPKAGKGGDTDLWHVNATQSGMNCVIAGTKVKIWRPGTKAGAKLQIKNGKTGKTADLVWPEGADTAAWPAGFSLDDGAKYLIRVTGEMMPTAVQIKVIESVKGNPGEKAVHLAEKGCKAQAMALLMSL